ncbi:MAG: magnesium transporter [Armatimonadetes bacterium]|nr:magnesium transporter [Armatimonadota bacterium]
MTEAEIRSRAVEAHDVAEAIRAATRSQVRGALEGLISGFHPIDIAFAMNELEPEERSSVFRLLTADDAGVVLEEVRDDITADLVEETPDRELAEIIDAMPPDAGADVVELIDDARVHRVLAHIPDEELAELQALRQHGSDTAGGLMNSEVLFAPQDLQVWALLAHLRNSDIAPEMLNYVYVVDEEHDRHLVGVVDMRQLVKAEPGARLGDFMVRDLVTVLPEEDQQQVVRLFDQYDLVSLPVVDEAGRLLGVVTVDDAIDALQEEHLEDISAMAGTSSEDLLSQSSTRVAGLRLPWLGITFLGTLVSALIIQHLGDHILAQYLALASFMPVNAAMAGNAGLQSATIVVRALALGQAHFLSIGKLLLRQFGTAVIIATACAGAASVAAGLMLGDWYLGLVVGVAMLLSILWATTTGASIPLLFERLGIDPAISAGPVVTTANDSVSLLLYFGVATLLLKFLTA